MGWGGVGGWVGGGSEVNGRVAEWRWRWVAGVHPNPCPAAPPASLRWPRHPHPRPLPARQPPPPPQQQLPAAPPANPHLRHGQLPRALPKQPHRRLGQAVVCVPQRDEVVVSGVQARHHHRHVVGLRAAAGGGAGGAGQGLCGIRPALATCTCLQGARLGPYPHPSTLPTAINPRLPPPSPNESHALNPKLPPRRRAAHLQCELDPNPNP